MPNVYGGADPHLYNTFVVYADKTCMSSSSASLRIPNG